MGRPLLSLSKILVGSFVHFNFLRFTNTAEADAMNTRDQVRADVIPSD
jgi:hypothetical protein